ncbi:Proteasome assembly chaperone 2 [Lunasporangiospora selenospora]|uniref:Proteasome assembly chaperone 2 n=1 Tax=Lunasporangiospora selenospora TaxID=979761 RepID=A0A9P6KA07_9FUNG|nr:Proteasome assembly chaperone 2 [Lunasporangiospora selenospora]
MNCFVPSLGFDLGRLKGSTLIVPSVSIGNVPQLSMDLLLTTLSLERVGCIEDENVIPVVGPADRPHGGPKGHSSPNAGISLAVEVFQTKDGAWTLIQQRSPTVSKRSHYYTDNLVQFIKDAGFGLVVQLTSADGARRVDTQLRSSVPVRYIASPTLSESLLQTLTRLELLPLENVSTAEDEARRDFIRREERRLEQERLEAAQSSSSSGGNKNGTGLAEKVQDIQLEAHQQVLEKVPRIPNGGIARRLHSHCQEQNVGILTIVKFAMEGDNAPDAIFLANVLNAVFKIHVPTAEQINKGEESWKYPQSWDSLYGNTFHQDMYQ